MHNPALVVALLVSIGSTARADGEAAIAAPLYVFGYGGSAASLGVNLGVTIADIARRKQQRKADGLVEMLVVAPGIVAGGVMMGFDWAIGAQQQPGVGSISELVFAIVATAQTAWSLALLAHGAYVYARAPSADAAPRVTWACRSDPLRICW
jgi:hypothetical protein